MLSSGIVSRLQRGVSVLLVLLIASPFTAPFSSCPFSFLFADSAAMAPTGVQLAATAHDDRSPSDDCALQLEEKLKDEAALPARAVSSTFLVDVVREIDNASARTSIPRLVSLVIRV
jgi:hypothetical protein